MDQLRQVVDAYGSRRPDGVAARRFFDHALGSTGVRPAEVTADKAPAYLRVRAAFDQLALAI